MNKLEEYRESLKLGETLETDTLDEHFDMGLERGFDAAIALDLPVKFADWRDNDVEVIVENPDTRSFSYEYWDKKLTLHTFNTLKELFDYWLNNIWEGV